MEDLEDSRVGNPLPVEGITQHRIPPSHFLQPFREIAEIASMDPALPLPTRTNTNRMLAETRLFGDLSLPISTFAAVFGAGESTTYYWIKMSIRFASNIRLPAGTAPERK
jgi:hypothetical protein